MSRNALILAGAAILLVAWAGPLPPLVPQSFAAHMALHMLVVGIAAPVLAAGIAPYMVVRRWPLALAVTAGLLDLVIIWLWHAPALHHASRSETWAFVLEQASFAGVALLVWLVAFGGPSLLGAMTLFFTSMHMTLLGVLLGLAPRAIYDGHAHAAAAPLGGALADQQLGGIIMLAVGGTVYLAGGLVLAARALRPVRTP